MSGSFSRREGDTFSLFPFLFEDMEFDKWVEIGYDGRVLNGGKRRSG